MQPGNPSFHIGKREAEHILIDEGPEACQAVFQRTIIIKTSSSPESALKLSDQAESLLQSPAQKMGAAGVYKPGAVLYGNKHGTGRPRDFAAFFSFSAE